MTMSQNNEQQTEPVQEPITDVNSEAQQSEAVNSDLDNSDEPIDPIEQARREERERVKNEMQSAINKRIDKEVWKRKTVENQANNQIKELRSIIDQLQPKEPEKTLADFNSDEEYISHRVEQAVKKIQTKPTQDAPKGDKDLFGDIVDDYTSKEQEYVKTNPDYYKNVNNLSTVFDSLISQNQTNQAKLFKEALYHANNPEITDYLARNLEDAEYIASLPPIKMGIEIAKLTGNLPGKNSTKQAEPTKPRVPPPPTTPRANAGGNKTINANELSDHEHFVYLSKKRLGLIK